MSPGCQAAGHDPAAYGDGCASYYDQIYPRVRPELVEMLRRLADGAPTLELGLATGRVARALAARGVDMHGIEASAAMLGQFRAHADHAAVAAVAGDIVQLPYRSAFGLVFAVCGTLELLPTRAQQQRCLAAVARVLRPGGWFACELSGLDGGGERIDTSVPLMTAAGLRTYRVKLLPIAASEWAGRVRDAGLVPVDGPPGIHLCRKC